MMLDVSGMPPELRLESASAGSGGSLVLVGDGWSASGSLDSLSAALRLPLEIVDDCLRVKGEWHEQYQRGREDGIESTLDAIAEYRDAVGSINEALDSVLCEMESIGKINAAVGRALHGGKWRRSDESLMDAVRREIKERP
jgi:hypothetical protein